MLHWHVLHFSIIQNQMFVSTSQNQKRTYDRPNSNLMCMQTVCVCVRVHVSAGY